MFIILIADISEWTINAVIEGFADDITASCIENNITNTISALENEASNILKFMASNQLIANDSKTALVIFGKKTGDETTCTVKVGSAKIVEKTSIKLLGLEISNDLKWKKHAEQLNNCLNYKLYMFKHIRDLLPDRVIPSISNALIISNIRYGLPVFLRPRLSDADPLSSISNRLQISHNNMTRAWLKVRRSDKTNMKNARTDLGIMSVNQMAVLSILSETKKIISYNTIPWIKTIICNHGTSNINTRASTSHKLRSLHSKSGKNNGGFINQATMLWNSIPMELRDPLCSDSVFKRKAKKWIISSNIP